MIGVTLSWSYLLRDHRPSKQDTCMSVYEPPKMALIGSARHLKIEVFHTIQCCSLIFSQVTSIYTTSCNWRTTEQYYL